MPHASDPARSPAPLVVPAPRESSAGHSGADQALAAEMLRRAMHTTDTSAPQIAYALGVSRSRVRAWLEPDGQAAPSLARLAQLAARMPRLYGAILDEQRRLVDARPGPGLSPLAHVARVAAEVGDVGRVTAEALADGTLDGRERETIAREARHAIAALEAMLRDVEGQ